MAPQPPSKKLSVSHSHLGRVHTTEYEELLFRQVTWSPMVSAVWRWPLCSQGEHGKGEALANGDEKTLKTHQQGEPGLRVGLRRRLGAGHVSAGVAPGRRVRPGKRTRSQGPKIADGVYLKPVTLSHQLTPLGVCVDRST